MSSSFPLSVLKLGTRESVSPTFAEMLHQVKELQDFEGPNTNYNSEAHAEMLHRVSNCFTEIINRINTSLSIPRFVKSEAISKNINCKKDFKKLQQLCENYLKTLNTKTKKKVVRTSADLTLNKSSFSAKHTTNFTEFLDSNLVRATDLVTGSNSLMEEINKKEYLSKGGKELIQRFRDITETADGRLSHILDQNKTSSKQTLSVTELTLRHVSRFGSVYSQPDVEKTESFYIRQASLKKKITEKQARAKAYERQIEVENILHNVQPEFDVVFHKIAQDCPRRMAVQANLMAELRWLEAFYEKQLKRNVETDRKLLREKTKLLSQLESWVKKYDSDIAGKMYLLNLAKDELQEQRDMCDEFFNEYDRQAEEYAFVMQCKIVDERIEEYRIKMANKKAKKAKGGSKRDKYR